MKYQPIINGITNFDLEPHQRREQCASFLNFVKTKIYPLGDEGENVGTITLSAKEKICLEVIAGIIAEQSARLNNVGRKKKWNSIKEKNDFYNAKRRKKKAE